MIELRALGGVGLYRDGVAVGGRASQRHQLALLAFLSVSPGGSASRDKLIGHLWPESDTPKARHRLSVALHVLRQELGRDVLTTSRDGVALSAEAVWTDVGTFLDAIGEGRLREAVELHRGPFLDGFFLGGVPDFEQWVESERAHIDGLYRAALEGLIAQAEARNDRAEAARWWERLAVHDPFSASTTLGHMNALAAAGDLGSAIRHARAYAALVEGELEIRPDPKVLELANELTLLAQARPRPLTVPAPTPDAGRIPAQAGGGRVQRARSQGVLLSVSFLALAVVSAAWLLGRSRRSVVVDGSPAVVVIDFASSGVAADTLGRALADRVVAALGHVPELRTHAWRISAIDGPAAANPDVGRASVVTGRVEVVGDRTRAQVEVRAGASGDALWVGEYETHTGRPEGLLEELSLDIAEDLRAHLVTYVPKEYTENRRAYDRFLQGVYAMRRSTSEDLWQALQFHREAWEEDPDFALAHAIAGNAYIALIGRGVSPEVGYRLAREHVLEALALDSTLAEGHAALGYIQIWGDHDFEAGAGSLRRAIMLYPTLPQSHTWYGYYLLHVRGRHEAAVRHVRYALDVDPLNTARSRDVETVLYRAGLYEDVELHNSVTWSLDEEVARTLRSSPLGHAYREMGRYEESIREFRELHERTGASLAGAAMAYGRMGRVAEALAIAREIEGSPGGGPPLSLARIYANVGDADRAFDWLRLAASARPDAILQITADPALEPIRDDPRFVEILERIGIPR